MSLDIELERLKIKEALIKYAGNTPFKILAEEIKKIDDLDDFVSKLEEWHMYCSTPVFIYFYPRTARPIFKLYWNSLEGKLELEC